MQAERGRVFDAVGRPLTYNRSCCSIRILPQWARDKDTLAGILAGSAWPRATQSPRTCAAASTCSGSARVMSTMRPETRCGGADRAAVRNCTYIDDDYVRVYPHGELCANVVGFTGDTCGLAGLEFEYDSVLRGNGGWVLLQKDAIGRAFPYPSYPAKRPVAGLDIDVTLDLDVQHICYDALKKQVPSAERLAARR